MFVSKKKIQKNRGMTYVELIVVLSIFAVMNSLVMFNYKGFQAKVDLKNLASDMALKVVEAQKSSLSGVLPQGASSTWKPSFGVYFNKTNSTQFVYFADFDNDGTCNTCNSSPSVGGEILDVIKITKGNYISDVKNGSLCPAITELTVLFKRPDSRPIVKPICNGWDYVEIDINSPQTTTGLIKVYPSGRIQIN